MERTTALIPHGFSNNGSWIQQAEIRQLKGYDEQFLAEIQTLPLPRKTTELLARVVTFGETLAQADMRKTIRNLTVGDRVALMLQLRRLVFGDKLSCVLNCPTCNKPMSLELSVTKLLQPPILQPKSEYRIQIDKIALTVRPANGADLEALVEKNYKKNLAKHLAKSCILYSEPPLNDKLNNGFLTQVSSKLEEIDPQADINLNLACPDCQHHFQAPFNAENFVLQELAETQKQLEREIHWIAFNYHWSEDSILSLPLTKRKRYVELINATLSGENV